MDNRRPIKEPILVFCGITLVLGVTWQFFQFVQLCSVGDSPPHFVAMSAVSNRKRFGKHSLWQSPLRVTNFYRYIYTDKLHIFPFIEPAKFPQISGTSVYDSENPNEKNINPNLVVSSTMPYLQIRTGPQEKYEFAEGSYSEYAFTCRRYIVGKIYFSGSYIAATVASFNVYAGIRQSKQWLIIWKRGQKQPVYHCPIHGELQAFALTK